MYTELKTIVSEMEDLPKEPMVAAQILQRLENPALSAKALSKAINSDPTLAARIIKTANSTVYRKKDKTTTVEKAIVQLGEQKLRDLILDNCLKSLQLSETTADRKMHTDAHGCAMAARIVARLTEAADPDQAFLAGMLRHIGKLVMLKRDPEMYQRIQELIAEPETNEIDVELGMFAFSHDLVGAALLEYWHFAPVLVQTTLHHHDFSRIQDFDPNHYLDPHIYNLSATVNIAEGLCKYLGIGGTKAQEVLELQFLPGAIVLSLSEGQIAQALDQLGAEWARR